MNWLLKTASVEYYFHGTSGLNLQSILAEGLIDHPDKLFSPDYSPRTHEHSIESYGGIYLTQNLMTALSSANRGNRKNKNPNHDAIIVIVKLENKTPHFIMDEDSLPSIQISITEVKKVNANGWWYACWAKDKFDQLDEIADAYLRFFKFYHKLTDTLQPMLENLRPIIKQVAVAHAIWNIALYMKNDWNAKYQFPEFADLDVAQCESDYRRYNSQLTQKARRTIEFMKGEFNNNLRSLQPIYFSGKNKIVAIVRIFDKYSRPDMTGDHNSVIEIIYAQADAKPGLDELEKQYMERIGNNFVIKQTPHKRRLQDIQT